MGEGDVSFQDRLDALVGRPPGGSGRSVAPDPVNQPMIRHWVAAFEDADPVYVDEAAAERFGGIVAPPLMLQTWTMATPRITGIAERGGSPVESDGESFMTVFEEAGFTGTLAVGSEVEVERHLHLGEVLHAETLIESISEQKQTRLGPGHFVTWVTTYATDSGEVVGRQTFRVLKFAPGGEA